MKNLEMKKRRKFLGLTQAELAEKCGCAIQYVVDNPFEFVTFRLLDSKQIHIFEFRDDEYYIVACVENALTGSYFYEGKENVK